MNWVSKKKNCSIDLLSKKTCPKNKKARLLAVFAMRRISFMSYQDIGNKLGGVSRTTVANLLVDAEKNYESKLHEIEEELLRIAT